MSCSESLVSKLLPSAIFKPDQICNISFILHLKIRSQDSKGPGASRIQTVRGPPGEAVSSVPLGLVAKLLHIFN